MLYDELATKCPELFKVIDEKIAAKDGEIAELKAKVDEQDETINQLLIDSLGGV